MSLRTKAEQRAALDGLFDSLPGFDSGFTGSNGKRFILITGGACAECSEPLRALLAEIRTAGYSSALIVVAGNGDSTGSQSTSEVDGCGPDDSAPGVLLQAELRSDSAPAFRCRVLPDHVVRWVTGQLRQAGVDGVPLLLSRGGAAAAGASNAVLAKLSIGMR